jgi:small-conductance mechanosensitive channel
VREVKSAFDEEGISIPFPQRTISERHDGRAEGAVDSLSSEHAIDGDRSD